MNKEKQVGLHYAISGLFHIFKTERNFRIHILCLGFVCIAGIFLSISLIEWIFISIVSGIVLITETLNSSIEKIMDFIEPHRHPEVKRIKDMSAGAVLLAAVLAGIVGFVIFTPKLYSLLGF